MFMSALTFLPMFVCGILSVLLGLSLYDRWDWPRFRLLLFMATATLLYSAHCIFFNHLTEAIPFSDTVYSFCNPAVYPLYYIYIEELTQHHPNRWRQLVQLFPAFLCFLSVGLFYLLMGNSETQQFVQCCLYEDDCSSLSGLSQWQAGAHLMVKVVFALQIPPILILGWRRISQYNRLVENYYSNTEGKTLYSIQQMLVLFVVASLVSFVCNILGRQLFTASPWMLAIPSLTFSVLLLLIGHVGLRQEFSVINIEEEHEADEAEDSLSIEENEDNIRQLQREVVQMIDQEQLFLQPNLKINELAARLNTNRNYLYQALNEGLGMSFSEYINRKRIDYSIQLMERNPRLLLTNVATLSGFSSTSAFYRNFRQFKGCSPSVYFNGRPVGI